MRNLTCVRYNHNFSRTELTDSCRFKKGKGITHIFPSYCTLGWDVIQASMYFLRLNTFAWWRHQMETVSALLALCAGNSSVTGEFPAQRPVTLWCFLWSAHWINGWVNNREDGDLRRHHAYDDVIVMVGKNERVQRDVIVHLTINPVYNTFCKEDRNGI